MSRDELIEELKKAPSNGEVYIRKFQVHWDRRGVVRLPETVRITKLDTIPNIIIEVEAD